MALKDINVLKQSATREMGNIKIATEHYLLKSYSIRENIFFFKHTNYT